MSITIRIPGTEHVLVREDADRWMREHVIVKRKDLAAVAALAKKLGFYGQLKALGVEMQELSPERSAFGEQPGGPHDEGAERKRRYAWPCHLTKAKVGLWLECRNGCGWERKRTAKGYVCRNPKADLRTVPNHQPPCEPCKGYR